MGRRNSHPIIGSQQSEHVSNEAKHRDDYCATRAPHAPHCSNYNLLPSQRLKDELSTTVSAECHRAVDFFHLVLHYSLS